MAKAKGLKLSPFAKPTAAIQANAERLKVVVGMYKNPYFLKPINESIWLTFKTKNLAHKWVISHMPFLSIDDWLGWLNDFLFWLVGCNDWLGCIGIKET